MKNYSEIEVKANKSLKVNDPLLDEFLSNDGGLVPSTVIFLTGTSGAGKTTVCARIQKSAVKKQIERMNIDNKNAFIGDEEDCKTFFDFMERIYKTKPSLVIMDSIQEMAKDFEMNEDKAMIEILDQLKKWAHATGGIVIIIGHVTKDGDFAGVNTIKHNVDVHIHLSFNKKTGERKMQSEKNRYGSVDVLCYEFTDDETGLKFFKDEKNIDLLESINDVIIMKMNQIKEKGGADTIEEFKSFVNSLSNDMCDSQKTIQVLTYLSAKEIF